VEDVSVVGGFWVDVELEPAGARLVADVDSDGPGVSLLTSSGFLSGGRGSVSFSTCCSDEEDSFCRGDSSESIACPSSFGFSCSGGFSAAFFVLCK